MDHHRQLVGEHRRQRDDLAEQRGGVAHERFRLDVRGRRRLGNLLHARLQIRADPTDVDEPHARQPLHDQPHRPVGLLEHLVDGGQRPDPVEIRPLRLLRRRVALREHADQMAAADGFLDELERSGPPRGEGQDRLWEQHGIAQRQDRQLIGHRRARVSLAGSRRVLWVSHGLVAILSVVRTRLRRGPPAPGGSRPPAPAPPPCPGPSDPPTASCRLARNSSSPRSGSACRACVASSLR